MASEKKPKMMQVSCKYVENGLVNARERVSFTIYVDATAVVKNDMLGHHPETIMDGCLDDCIAQTKEIRGIEEEGTLMLIRRAKNTIFYGNSCSEHKYRLLDVTIQPVRVRKLRDMCMDLCIENLLAYDPVKNELTWINAGDRQVVPAELAESMERAALKPIAMGIVQAQRFCFAFSSPFERGSLRLRSGFHTPVATILTTPKAQTSFTHCTFSNFLYFLYPFSRSSVR